VLRLSCNWQTRWLQSVLLRCPIGTCRRSLCVRVHKMLKIFVARRKRRWWWTYESGDPCFLSQTHTHTHTRARARVVTVSVAEWEWLCGGPDSCQWLQGTEHSHIQHSPTFSVLCGWCPCVTSRRAVAGLLYRRGNNHYERVVWCVYLLLFIFYRKGLVLSAVVPPRVVCERLG
jgi:hypothetical protein